MSHLSNPLATADQLYARNSADSLPIELQDSIRFYTARLTQAAGILLRLPQDITAQANVLLFRFWLVDNVLDHEFSDVSAATLYLTAKISASPRSLRSITNVYTYLLSSASTLQNATVKESPPPDPELYYLSEGTYLSFRNRLLHIEGLILNALGFNTHVALPHPLAITYLQTLDIFSAHVSKDKARAMTNRTLAHLNSALLSPQMLYLTHQPCALATAAIYLASKEVGVKMPEVEWWEVFDCEREELGFLVVALGSLEGLVRKETERWEAEKGMVTRRHVESEAEKMGVKRRNGRAVDEEDEMAMMLDKKTGAD